VDWVPALSPLLEDPADDAVLVDVLLAVLLALLLPGLAAESPLTTLPLLLAALSLAPVLAPSLLVAS